MSKNPLINALLAALYIVLVGSVMFYGSRIVKGPDSVLAPIAMISLFTFSAAVMGFLFLSQPFVLLFEGKKKEAVGFFLKSVAAFGAITALLLVFLFSNAI